MIAYKFLAKDALAPLSKRAWPLPAGAEPGAWLEAAPGTLEPCRNGVHACELVDLVYWIGEELWQVELADEWISGPQSVIARRGRLLRRIDAWNANSAAEFARACLERAQRFVDGLPTRRGAAATAEILDQGAQYLATARSTCDAGKSGVAAYASAMAFTLLEPSAAQAFRDERSAQGELLKQVLRL